MLLELGKGAPVLRPFIQKHTSHAYLVLHSPKLSHHHHLFSQPLPYTKIHPLVSSHSACPAIYKIGFRQKNVYSQFVKKSVGLVISMAPLKAFLLWIIHLILLMCFPTQTLNQDKFFVFIVLTLFFLSHHNKTKLPKHLPIPTQKILKLLIFYKFQPEWIL